MILGRKHGSETKGLSREPSHNPRPYGVLGQAQRDLALVSRPEGAAYAKAPSPLRSAGALHRFLHWFLIASCFLECLSSRSLADTARGQRGIVATVHPIATEAARVAFQRGGNAIDAAVAAALTLGVVDGFNSGIGGGCFMLIRSANGRTTAIDAREAAPLAATRDMYLRHGRFDPQLSQLGPLAVGIPGALWAYHYAVAQFGRLTLADHLLHAAQIAERGFVIDERYARRLEESARDLSLFEASRVIFLRPDGSPKRPGEILVQPDLANSYRAIINHGVAWFYYGVFPILVGDWMARNGGIIIPDDFAIYQAKLRTPLATTYRGHTIVGFPPPSSGGVHVAQILNILENFDLKTMGTNSVELIHVVTEAMKLAFADRSFWLGDPGFAKVPRGLVSKPYAAALAKKINLERATPVPRHSIPAAAAKDFFSGHTTHFSTADAAGNWVACTATLNTSFGSKVVIPGTGIVLNNQMDDFSAQPGVPNYFGLIGGEANAIAPRKRPLSSMSPTMVLKDGKPILSLGAAGGPTIISQTLLTIIHVIDFGMDLETALRQPRFHHQWLPDELRMERRIDPAVVKELEKRGHKVGLVESIGPTQAVARDLKNGGLVGANDPRVNGKAAGW